MTQIRIIVVDSCRYSRQPEKFYVVMDEHKTVGGTNIYIYECISCVGSPFLLLCGDRVRVPACAFSCPKFQCTTGDLRSEIANNRGYPHDSFVMTKEDSGGLEMRFKFTTLFQRSPAVNFLRCVAGPWRWPQTWSR